MGDERIISLRGLSQEKLQKQKGRVLDKRMSAPPDPSLDEGFDEDRLPEGNVIPARSVFHKASYPPRLSLNGLLISLILATLLVAVGFLPMDLPSPLNGFYNRIDWMEYSFQLPMALFMGAFLGPFMGPAALLALMACGLLAYPVFAGGGGLDYVLQPGFGYWIGMLGVSALVGRTFHKVFQQGDDDSRSLKLLGLVVASVLLVHMVGLVYLSGLCVAGQVPWTDWIGLSLRLSAEPLAYDLLSTMLLFCLVRQLRLALWVVLY